MRIVKFEFSLFGINTYVVVDTATRDCAIIDPGMINEEERSAMANFIANNNLHVVHLINTHLHIDHAIGNNWVRDKYNVDLMANMADEPLGERIKEQATMFGIPAEVKGLKIDTYLLPGDKIKIGEGSLDVIHVPGHSPGSIALYDATDGFLISGDALFAGSIGRTDLPGGSTSQLLQSIREKLFVLPEETIVYPGHGGPTTIGREIRSNPFFK